MVAHECYPNTWEIEARELPLVQGHYGLHSELQGNLGKRPCLKKKN